MILRSTTDYRALLKRELELRCQTNPRYSLRSFARDLKIAPARLSDVLRGRYGLSRESAEKIAKRIDWSEQERNFFCDLVDSTHARSRKAKEQARSRITPQEGDYKQLTLDAFQVVADWYHHAILELTYVRGFDSDSDWIAKRLGISSNVVVPAIDRLKRLGLIDESPDGTLKATDAFTASPSGIPSDAIKKFHRQVLEKAIAAIHLQTVDERDFSAVVTAIDTGKLPEAKRDIREFRRSFNAKYGTSENKKEVYCLALQFFSLEAQRPNESHVKES